MPHHDAPCSPRCRPFQRLWLVVTAIVAAASIASSSQAKEAPPPNIVVFLVDDMGVMDTSVPFLADASGKPEAHPLNRFFRTPSMDRLARQGVRFSQFYAMSVCSPTRVSIMTGQTSARHHTTQYIKPESNNRGQFGPRSWKWKGISKGQVTLAALMRQGGYRTIFSGKAHFGPNDSFGELPQNFGFDVNIAGCAYGQPGSYYGLENFGHGKKGRVNRAVPGLTKYHGKDINLTEALTIEMNAAITDAVRGGKPFFAYMSHYAVHAPFQPDKRFIGNYKKPPAIGDASADTKPRKGKGRNAGNRGFAFASMIEGMDKSLGDMLNHLEKLGVAENTLVLFLGDNGTDAPLGSTHGVACAAPLRGKKATHYEGGMRVPFIAAWAKPNDKHIAQKRIPIARGVLNTRDFGAVYDVFATVLAAAAIDPAKAAPGHPIDGINLAPLLSGAATQQPAERAPRAFLMHFPHQHRSSYFTSYRLGDWKLIYHYRKTGAARYELFNLAKDRDESDNLATTQPRKLREMVTAMSKALEDADAQYVVNAQGKPVKPALP